MTATQNRALVAMLFFSISHIASAQLGAKLKNNSAVKKFQKGDIAAGQEAINDALVGDAGNSVILYNWAGANLSSVLGEMVKEKKNKLTDDQKKRIESAQKEFSKLLQQNSPIAKQLRKEALYQNALSLELLEKNSEALMNYYRSLNEENAKLDGAYAKKLTEKTQTNIAHLLVKSQSDSSSGKGEGGGGGGEGENKESGGDSQGENEGKDGEQQKSQGQGQRREPEFSGTDVNEAQAQQILNSVSNQDRQVQQRKGQQQSKQNMQNGEEGEIDSSENDKPW